MVNRLAISVVDSQLLNIRRRAPLLRMYRGKHIHYKPGMPLNLFKITGFICALVIVHLAAYAQDSTHKGMIGLDSFFRRQKGLVGKLARNLVHDTTLSEDPNTPTRNDLVYGRYEGRIIRSIQIQRLDFGTPITDTTRNLRNNLTRLA